MADETPPPAGDASKPAEKKDTVRITLPPRPVAPSSAGAPPPGAAGPTKLPATVAAVPIVPKKETSRLKKTTGNVPGATKPAAPVVPPPTVRAQPVPQAPTTVAAAPAPPPTAPAPAAAPAPSSPGAGIPKPTVKLQTADIPKIPSPPAAPLPAAPAAAPAARPVQAPSGGPELLDMVLSIVVMVTSGLTFWFLLKAHFPI